VYQRQKGDILSMSEQASYALKFSTGAILCLAGALATPASALFQGAPTKPPSYDVASIKPNKSESGSVSVHTTPGNYAATNVSLKMLLSEAYGIKEYLISGGPNWINSARFDVTAKVLDADIDALKKLTQEQKLAMMQPFLVDRFALAVHTETKLLPVYELVVVKSGPKFNQSAPEQPAAEDGEPKPLGTLRRGGMMINNSELTASAVPLSSLASQLSYTLHRTVIDKTGLTAKYDLKLKWAPEHGPDNSPESSEASLFTALQEQLGLKLQSAKGAVETLVIDHVEMPSEN
jgi:uncharacterized protein (TIGR03435 family)